MHDDSLTIQREASSLRQQVTDRLREAILDGRLAPGARLVERELCSLLDVSRTLLREALQHLQAEGLIVVVPHRGPSVARIDAAEAREIYQVRESLEALAGAGFARHASEAQRRALRQALRELAGAARSAQPARLLAAKNRFYATLLEGCGNRVVGQLLTQLNNRVMPLRRLSLAQPGRLAHTLAELEAVVDAVEARDARRAGRLCAAHVRAAAAVVAQGFTSAAGPASGRH